MADKQDAPLRCRQSTGDSNYPLCNRACHRSHPKVTAALQSCFEPVQGTVVLSKPQRPSAPAVAFGEPISVPRISSYETRCSFP